MTRVHSAYGLWVRRGLAAVAFTFLGTLDAQAVNLFWSGNGTTQGGAGTWNTSVARWADAAAGNPAGTYGTIWNNAGQDSVTIDSAEFGGTVGTVNLGGPIVVNTITTDLALFVIGNSGTSTATNTITFSGTNAGVNTTTTGTTTINAVMSAPNGLVKSGIGRLEMGNIGTSQPTTNKYILNNGIISSASIARVGGPTAALVQDFMTFNGGGWGISTGNQDTGAFRGITVKSGGAFFGSSSTTINLTISSPIVGTEGGGVSIVGNSGPFTNNGMAAGAVVFLNNTSNSWDGNLTLNGASGSKFVMSQSNVVPDTAIVNMSASGNTFDMSVNNTTETIKSISGTAGTVAVGTGTLTINNPNGESYSSVFTGLAGGKVIKNGSGAWTLSGGSNGFNGEFVMNSGTLGVGGSNIFGNGTDGTDASTFTYAGGVLSNTGTGGRTIPAGVTVNLNANLTADDSLFNSSQPGQILFNGTATLTVDRTFTINNTANVGFADIRESGGARNIIKDGNGTLAMTGTTATNPNAFTGSVTVNAGRLQVGGGTYVGNESNTIVLNGGALNTSATRTVNLANPISVTANSAITTTSTAATPNFDFSNDNPFTFANGSVVLTMRNDGGDAASDQLRVRLFGGGFNIANNIDLPAGTAGSSTELSSFNTNAQSAQTFSGAISGTGNFKRSASTGGTGGTTIFLGQNTFSGGTQLNDGTIEFGVDSVGSPGSLTSGPVGTGTITTNNNATVAVKANGGARTVGNAIAFGAGNNLGITGSNNLTLSGDVSLGASARTVSVDNSGLSVLSGTISGAGGSLGKALGGVLKVTGNNTYDSGTTVSAGTLLVSNTIGSGTGSGSVTVASTGVLGGTGTVGGAIANSGVIAPGEGGIGTLSVTGDVINNTGAIWHAELSGASSDKLVVTGNVDLSATGDFLSVTGTGTGSSWLIGTYTGTLTGTFDTITSGYTVDYSGGNITLNAAVAGLPGDFNSDGKVDGGDYVTWRKNDGTNNALANDNGLGVPIGPAHYTLWRANYGNPPGAGSGSGLGGNAAVPEPSAIALLAIGLVTLGLRRRD